MLQYRNRHPCLTPVHQWTWQSMTKDRSLCHKSLRGNEKCLLKRSPRPYRRREIRASAPLQPPKVPNRLLLNRGIENRGLSCAVRDLQSVSRPHTFPRNPLLPPAGHLLPSVVFLHASRSRVTPPRDRLPRRRPRGVPLEARL